MRPNPTFALRISTNQRFRQVSCQGRLDSPAVAAAGRLQAESRWPGNVGGYTYAPFKVAWKEICQEIEAVVIEDPGRSVVPDHKLVMVAFDKTEPAYFVSGLLNPIPVGLFVTSYAVQTSISGHIFDYVAFPQFDSKDTAHRDVAKHARDLHSAKTGAIAELEEKLNQAVALTLGIPQADLKLMRREL